MRAFWGPMVLPAALHRGTWYHGLTVWRVVPESVASRPWFITFSRVAENLWSALGLGLVVLGMAIIMRRRRWRAALLLVLPVAVFVGVSLFTVAEARFRLPVAPFYVALQAAALVAIGARLQAWRERRRAAQAPREAGAAARLPV
jgi:hypothetical protein